jgi:hypothetical protein
MRTAKYIILSALLITLSLLLAVQVPWTQQRLAPLVLSWAGLQQVNLDLAGFDSGQMRITSFAATLDRSAGPIEIRVTNAICSYQLWGLLQGRLDGIRAATVDITLPTAPVVAKEPSLDSALPDLTGLIRRMRTTWLPVRQLHIQQLLIHHGAAAAKKDLALTVDLTATEKEGLLTINPAIAGPNTASPITAILRVANSQLTGTLQLQLPALQGLLPAIDSSPQIQGSLKAELHAELHPENAHSWHLFLTLTGLRHSRMVAEEIKLQLDGSQPLQGNPLILAATSQVSLKNFKSREVTVTAAETNLAGQVDIRPHSWRLQLKPATPWTVNGLIFGELHFAPLRFNAITADLQMDREHLQAACSFAAPQGSGTLATDLTWQRTGEQKGKAALRTTRPLVMSEKSNLLQLLADPAPPVTLDKGELNLSTQCTWSRKTPPELQAIIDFTGGKGLLYGAPFSGFTVQQQLRLLPKLASLKPGIVELVQLQGPIPVDNFLLKTSLSPSTHGRHPKLLIEQAGAELFGGKMHLENCAYDSNNPQSECLLQIDDFDLQQIIALQKVEELKASGRVYGNLPLHFTPQGVTVDQGQLQSSSEGGIIRYQPAGGALQGSPLPAYALKALEEFHYQRLTALVNYVPDGALAVNLQLQGNNPKLENTRPVHLNIGTEQNLLSLLRSLQYSHELTSELDRRVQQHTNSLHAK